MTFRPPELRVILDQVQANNSLLESCPGPHDFVNLTPERPLGARYRCSQCKGTAPAMAVRWYMDGLAHGKNRG